MKKFCIQILESSHKVSVNHIKLLKKISEVNFDIGKQIQTKNTEIVYVSKLLKYSPPDQLKLSQSDITANL